MDFTIEKGFYYSTEHEWVQLKEGKAYIGISGYAAHHLGDIVFVELPELESEVSAGSNIGVIESVKAVADMHSPVSGTIIEVNEELETSPELLNQSPYQSHIAVLEIKDEKELEDLMDAAAYQAFCAELD
ncbi:MAG: glycine cleavage system protein GcvH [Methylocystaceae bacterium]